MFTEIKIVVSLADASPVPVQHTGNAVYALDSEGGRWVRKREADMGCEGFIAETLSWLVARRVGAPVPAGAVFTADGAERSWLSSVIPAVAHWNAALAPFVINTDELGAILALDTVVLNEDRHAGNILLEHHPDELHLRVWAIDHDDAIVGRPDDFVARRNSIPSARNLARGLPIDLIAPHAVAAAERLRDCSSAEIHGLVQECCLLAHEPRSEDIGSVLFDRCRTAPELVSRYLDVIRSSP